ncbi:hypothetical protein D038_4662B, partial [Vibrio parahaemolyticus IDH02189]
ERRAY